MTPAKTPDPLAGRRILLVEDTAIVAEELLRLLHSWGCLINGPQPTLAEARQALRNDRRIEVALLDVNLRGELVFPLAQELVDRSVPFAFLTGYGPGTIPPSFAARPTLEKPFGANSLRLLVERLMTLVSG